MELTKSELQAKWEAQDWQETEQAIRELLTSAQGRRLLRRWLGFGKIGVNPFAPNALTMSFSCGELNVGQQILADLISTNPEGWITLQKEMNDEHRTRDSAYTSADND